MTAFNLTVVARCVWFYELMPDSQISSRFLKQSHLIAFAVGKAVGEFKAVVGLDTLYPDTPAGIPLEQPFEKVSGRIGGLLRVSGQEAQSGKLIHGSVLKQAQLRVRDTAAGHHLHIHLNALSRIGHLLIRLGPISRLLLYLWE